MVVCKVAGVPFLINSAVSAATLQVVGDLRGGHVLDHGGADAWLVCFRTFGHHPSAVMTCCIARSAKRSAKLARALGVGPPREGRIVTNRVRFRIFLRLAPRQLLAAPLRTMPPMLADVLPMPSFL